MKIEKASVHRNPFIGLFFKTSSNLTLCPKNTPPRVAAMLERVLETKLMPLFIDESPLVGIFSALNANGLVLPEFASNTDISSLKKTGLNVMTVSEFSPGNSILCNDKAALVNPDIPADIAKKISDCLGVEVVRQHIGIKTVGAGNAVTNKGLLAYNDTSDVELKFLEKLFHVKGITGTTNFGSPFNGLGLVANDKGAIVGEITTGVENQRVYEALEG